MTIVLVVAGLYLAFLFGWLIGATASMSKQADEILQRFECRDPEGQWIAEQRELDAARDRGVKQTLDRFREQNTSWPPQR